MIHPLAIVHPGAAIHPSVEVGPFCVIDEHVTLGEGCRLDAGARLTGHTHIGRGNRFHSGCVIGDSPQDLKYKDEPTRLRIGDNNVFREHFTVHRANKIGEDTVIGSNNFFMAGAHVGHNSIIGNHVIIANGALLAGHVVVEDKVFISGNCLVHQFVKIGTLALMQGFAGIGQDLPPYTIATGVNQLCGLNVIGLRRAGFSAAERLELKRLYRVLFLEGRNLRDAIRQARDQFSSLPARVFLDFISDGRRGVCRHIRSASSPDREEVPESH